MPAAVYIQIFIGDYIRDTRLLSLEARAVYMDLLCYLKMSSEEGVITFVITKWAGLLGIEPNKIKILLDEIFSQQLLVCENMPDGSLRISDPAMLRKKRKSQARSEAGKKGMSARYNKNLTPDIAIDITNVITKEQQNTGNGIGNNNGYGNEEKGGVGEKEPEAENDLIWVADVQRHSSLTLGNCLTAFIHSPHFAGALEQLCIHNQFLIRDPLADAAEVARLRRWGEAFNRIRTKELLTRMVMHEWAGHFANWLRRENKQNDPDKICSENDNRTNQHGPANGHHQKGAHHGGNATGRGSSIADLQSLKRGRGPDDDERTEFATATVVG